MCENKNFDGKWHQWRDFKEKWKLMFLLLPLGAVSETEDAPKETANGFQFQEIIMQGEKNLYLYNKIYSQCFCFFLYTGINKMFTVASEGLIERMSGPCAAKNKEKGGES